MKRLQGIQRLLCAAAVPAESPGTPACESGDITHSFTISGYQEYHEIHRYHTNIWFVCMDAAETYPQVNTNNSSHLPPNSISTGPCLLKTSCIYCSTKT
jgi:hypothetical protein